MAETTPVDFDPFAAPKAVEFDPFAAPKAAPPPPPPPPAAPPAEPEKPRLGSSILKNLFSPRKFEEEERKTKGEAATGVLSGGAQTLVGIPQFAAKAIPGKTGDDVEQYLAETQQKLKEQGPEAAQEVGKFVPYLFGGKALGLLGRIPGAARVGEYLYPETLAKGVQRVGGAISDYLAPGSATVRAAPAAAEAVTAAQAAEKLSTTEQILKGLKEGLLFTGKEVAKGAAGGAILGGVTGAIAPRAEATKEERSEAMWNDIVDGLELGGEFGAGFGIVGAGIKGAKAFWKSATLSEQKKMIEEAEKVLKEKKAKVSDLAGEAIEREGQKIESASQLKSQTEAALSPTEQKIEELAKASREAERRELYESTEAKVLETAKQTGMTRKQAEAYVAEQQRIVDTAKGHADELAAKFANRPTMTANELGSEIQTRAEAMEKALDEVVKKESGYAALEAKYASGKPVFSIKPVISAIDAEIKKNLASDATYYLSSLKQRLENAAKNAGGDGAVSFRVIDQARTELNDAYSKGIIQKSGAARSSGGAQLKILEPIMSSVESSLVDTEKSFEAVLNNYAKLKKPLDPYGKKGVFEGVTEKQYGDTFKKFEGDVLTQVLGRTQKGGEGLAELVAGNTELKDKVLQHLNEKLFGASQESAAKVTANAFDKFKKQYGVVIERAGLTGEFEELAASRKAVEQRITEAEKGLSEARALEKSTKEKLGMEEKLRTFETKQLEETAAPLRKTANDAAKEILEAQSQKEKFETLQSLIRTTSKEDMSSQLRSFLTRIRERDPSALPQEQFEALLESIEKAGAAYKDSNDALKFAQDLRTYLVTKGLTTAGLSIGSGYGLYRLGRRGE